MHLSSIGLKYGRGEEQNMVRLVVKEDKKESESCKGVDQLDDPGK